MRLVCQRSSEFQFKSNSQLEYIFEKCNMWCVKDRRSFNSRAIHNQRITGHVVAYGVSKIVGVSIQEQFTTGKSARQGAAVVCQRSSEFQFKSNSQRNMKIKPAGIGVSKIVGVSIQEQFTTSRMVSAVNELVCQRSSEFQFKSNSQLYRIKWKWFGRCVKDRRSFNSRAIHNYSLFSRAWISGVSKIVGVSIQEQFTTDVKVWNWKATVCQRSSEFQFKSNSQRKFMSYASAVRCVKDRRSFNSRAIHNSYSHVSVFSSGVSKIVGVSIQEQFTTWRMELRCQWWVCQRSSEFQFKSNSQPTPNQRDGMSRCVKDRRSFNSRAIHNNVSAGSASRIGVSKIVGVSIQEQFTTQRVMRLLVFAVCQRSSEFQFKSNSQPGVVSFKK